MFYSMLVIKIFAKVLTTIWLVYRCFIKLFNQYSINIKILSIQKLVKYLQVHLNFDRLVILLIFLQTFTTSLNLIILFT